MIKGGSSCCTWLAIIAGLAMAAAAWMYVSEGTGPELEWPIKGMAYAPNPLRGLGRIQNDDLWTDVAEQQWDEFGRDDLGLLRDMGVNSIRVYGADVDKPHTRFLDRADEVGMSVFVGMSDYYFIQHATRKCAVAPHYNCFDVMKDAYGRFLRNGLLDGSVTGGITGNAYHPAVKILGILNEPDLKVFGMDGKLSIRDALKAVISAWDGMLAAEREANVKRNLCKFTITWSFAECSNCLLNREGREPGLTFMREMHAAIEAGDGGGYPISAAVKAAYKTRYLNSFNTQNRFDHFVVQRMLDLYDGDPRMNDKGIFIGELHSQSTAAQSLKDDLLRSVERATPDDRPGGKHGKYLGAYAFEFTRAYHKGGDEMNFGIFLYGQWTGKHVGPICGERCQTHQVFCLTDLEIGVTDRRSGKPQEVAAAYGGAITNSKALCPEMRSAPPAMRGGVATCALHPGCAALSGDCCPDPVGRMLGCC